jgi:hypothetical protein
MSAVFTCSSNQFLFMFLVDLLQNRRHSGNFCVAPVLESSRTSSTLRFCAPWASKNSSELLGFERGLVEC